MKYHLLLFSVAVLSILSACTPTRSIATGTFEESEKEAGELVSTLPNYSETLKTITGKGRAMVSEPDFNERVTLEFNANRTISLITIKNQIGIEVGQMLVNPDSILIYYKIDKFAQKLSIYDNRLTSLNELASVNILDLINYKVENDQVEEVLEDENSYLLRLKHGAEVYLNKETGYIWQVIQTRAGMAPYSRIIYESYAELKGYTLPRKITIFSDDGDSRVVFLVQSLDVNRKYLDLTLEIPENIKIERL